MVACWCLLQLGLLPAAPFDLVQSLIAAAGGRVPSNSFCVLGGAPLPSCDGSSSSGKHI